ncbi:insecticidal delta-endotoxin [Bacillus cereus]|uniref:insecticidal delta-endotoxin n=1 Tax=Bacillus cereus TaxID=1396 RepID=UPI000902B836|nr:insecticidal delta-endotoxin [Bacillus cereus]
MAQLQELQIQPVIPYNVLASPQIGNLDTQPGSLDDLIESLKEAWTEFQKTGSDKLLQTTLQNGFSAASGGSFNYLAVLQAGIGLFGTLGAEIPGVAVAAPILSMVIGWLWPHKSGDDGQQLVDLIDAEIQKQLNQALSTQDKHNWVGYLDESFLNASHNVARAVTNAQFVGTEGNYTAPRTPTASDYTTVETTLFSTEGSYHTGLSQMLNGNFDTLALPFYVIGVTMQLATYQTFIQFGEKWIDVVWPDNQTPGTTGYTHYQTLQDKKTDMRTFIQQHTTTVYNAFKKGMPPLESNKNSINAYNVYVRGMVLNGLDMVATWPSMYPDDYPTQMALEQTRVIFSDMVGQDQTRDGNTTIYNIFDSTSNFQHGTTDINSIHYFPDELQQAQIAEYSPSRGNHCYPYGIILNYQHNTYRYGDNDPGTSGTVFPAPMRSINAKTQNTSYLNSENLFTDLGSSTNCYIPGTCTNNCSPGSSCTNGSGYGESCNVPLPNQKINALYPFTQEHVSGDSGKLGLMASLVPYGLSPNNVFGEFDSDTQAIIGKGFPAEKGYIGNGSPVSVVREWVNGANAVQLPAWDTFKITATNLAADQYHIRVRYASTAAYPTNAKYPLSYYVLAGDTILQQGKWEAIDTSQADITKQVYVTGQQGNYILTDILGENPITLPKDEITVQLLQGNPAGGMTKVLIDRIEFVPAVINVLNPQLNYQISSQLPAWNNNQSMDPFPTIWRANPGIVGTSANITVADLLDMSGFKYTNITALDLGGQVGLFAKIGIGTDSDPNNWKWMCPDGQGENPWIGDGTYNFNPKNSGSCFDKSFTAIKLVGGTSFDTFIAAGILTGTVTTQKS